MIAAIEKRLELDQSPTEVWRALTDSTQVACWFGDSATFSLELGNEGWFGWEGHGRHAMRVVELDPPTRFAWRWAREVGKPLGEVDSTLVEWTLLPREDGGTTLLLKESGFTTDESRQENVGGWKKELSHLISHLDLA